LQLLAFYLNLLEYGSVIILVHDLPNIPTQLLVLLTAVREGPLGIAPLIVTYVTTLVVWSYYMLWVFPYEIGYLCHTAAPNDHFGNRAWWIVWMFGSLLVIHHIYVLWKLVLWIPRFVNDPKGVSEKASKLRE